MAITTERSRASTRTATGNPVWRKAPGSLLRHPSLFAALALGAFLVAVSTAAYPLFLSASGSALVGSEIEDPSISRFGAGVAYTATNVGFAKESPDGHGLLIDRRREVFGQKLSESPAVGPVIEQAMGNEVALTGPDGLIPKSGPVNGVLFAGDDVLDNVDIIDGTDGDGVWLPDYVATPMQVGPGDQIEIRSGDTVIPVTVDGTYRALYAQPIIGYWRWWSEQLLPCPDCSVPPQPILVDRQQLIEFSAELDMPRASFVLAAPVRAAPPLTLDEARTFGAFATDLGNELTTAGPSPLRRLLPCCGRLYYGTRHSSSTELLGTMPGVVRVVDQRIAATQGPIQVLFLAAILISFAVVSAAGVFSFTSRRADAGVLAVRGWGPGRVGVKAVLESALPCVTGAFLGFLVAAGTIAWLGPDGLIEPAARASAIAGSIAATIAVILVVGVVSGLSYASRHEPREGVTRFVLYFPWELLAFAGAYAMSSRLHASGGVVGTVIVRPAAAAFLFPLLLAFGVAIVAARVFALALAHRRPGNPTRVSAWYLAVRRLASSARLGMLLLVAAALALAVFAASQAMVSSLRTTVEAKAKVFVGSDVGLQIGRDTVVPPDFPFPATIATRSRQAGQFPDIDLQFDLLSIDPATFERAAYWNSAFSDRSVADLMGLLSDPQDDRLPVIMANGNGIVPTSLEIQEQDVPIDVVAQVASVPGTSSERPVFVVSDDLLHRAFAGLNDPLHVVQASREMWIRGPSEAVLAAAADAGIESFLTITADQVADIPFIKAAIDTFLVLDVLGIVALVLVLVVAIVYLQARQRSRVVSTALSARMGLASGTMRRSLVLELGTLLFVALAVGGTTGLIGAAVVIPYLDPLPTIPPDPISVTPWIAIAVAAIGLAAAAIVGGWLATRAARNVRLGEALRVAE